MFLKGLPAVFREGLPVVLLTDLTTFPVPVTFFVVAMHEQSESTISINPHTFSLFNGQTVFGSSLFHVGKLKFNFPAMR